MAVGDVKSTIIGSVGTATYATVRPGAGEEWVVHNLYFGGPVEVYFADGSNDFKFEEFTVSGAALGLVFHVTNSHYIKVMNDGTVAIPVGYDGVQTK